VLLHYNCSNCSQDDTSSLERYLHALARRLPALVSVLCRLLASGGRAATARAEAASKAAATSAELAGTDKYTHRSIYCCNTCVCVGVAVHVTVARSRQ
jgi:hypothetical protein